MNIPKGEKKTIMKVIINDLRKNEFSVYGADFERVHFFKNGQILLSKSINRFEPLQADENGLILKDKKICHVNTYDFGIYSITLNNIKRKNKIDLSERCNFYTKHIYQDYEKNGYYGKAYDLFIYVDDISVKFEKVGEFLSSAFDGAKNYQNAYKVTFKQAETKNYFYERVICDNYTLKENEVLSDSYGTKERPCVSYYDCSTSLFNPKNEKRIARRWTEVINHGNYSFYICDDYYTRTEKDQDRLNKEQIAEDFEKILNRSVSHYDIERLLNVYNISKK